MATISAAIALHDNFTGVLDALINGTHRACSVLDNFSQIISRPADTSSIDNTRDAAEEAAEAIREMEAAMQGVSAPDTGVPIAPQIPDPVHISVIPDVPDPLVDTPPPVEVPVEWQSDGMQVFTDTGIDRFRQEAESANSMMNVLSQTQARIAQTAAQTDLFPDAALNDINNMNSRMAALQQRIQQISANPVNMHSDRASAELEGLRGQLDQMVQQQEAMNRAVQNMDVPGANQAYLQLSRNISNTERYIRDNTNAQGAFRNEIDRSTNSASGLNKMIASAVRAFTGMALLRKARDWIDDCTEAFNIQLNAENQLSSVLVNMLDADYVAQFETAVDTTGAISDINAIQGSIDEVTIPVTAETRALDAAFDQITAKASEIQSKGIYGDESMIAAAAEFATYFTDTDAITMMMDTLSDYAMGMTGGGEIGTQEMVDYATNLGKIMVGSYNAMTKKGFEFTDAQKAIIEGEATREQIAATLGEEYLDMSEDMQAAAAISQVIDESWAGLYERMSDTPQGKIIQMTNAWGDMKEVIGGQLYPYVILLVDAINSNWGTIQTVIDGITAKLQSMLEVMSWLMEGAFGFAQAVADNWSWIEPIIMGVVGVLGLYYGWLLAIKTAEMISAGVKIALAAAEFAHAAMTGAEASATALATAEQYKLNTAMLSSPVFWIAATIIGVVAAIFAVCNAIAKLTGVANSGFGVICGGVNVVISFFYNLGLTVANIALGIAGAIGALCTNMMTAFGNAISSVQSWFYDLLSTGLTVVAGICEALNKLPFVEFDYSGITAAADEYAGKAADAANNKGEYVSVADAFSEGYSTFDAFGDGWASDAFKAGASWGDGVADKVSGLFGGADVPSMEDYGAGTELAGIGDGVNDIAGSTGAIADSLDITEEDLKYLRDIAEQEAVNRYTTAEITIEQTNNNNVSSGMDLDGVVTGLTDAVNEAVSMITEGVHD